MRKLLPMRLSTLLLFSCIAVPAFAGDVAQIVNFTGGTSLSASPAPTVSFTTVAGDSIIALACIWQNTTSVPVQSTPTDTLGSTWTSELSVDNAIGANTSANCHVWRVRNATAGSETTITFGGGTGTMSWTWHIYQVRYLETGAPDVTANAVSASSNSSNLSFTTTNANDFVVGINFNQSASTRSPVNYGNNYYGGCYDIESEGTNHGWSCTDFSNKTATGTYKAQYIPAVTTNQIGIAVAFKVLTHACGGTDYASVRTLTIDHTKVGSSDLTNFPSLWCANSAGTCNAAYTDFKVSGSGGTVQSTTQWNTAGTGSIQLTTANDLIVCDAASGGHYVNFDWARYDPTGGDLAVFIAPTTTSHSVDTPVYIFYGNANDKGHHGTQNTWQNGFIDVWHEYYANGGQLWDVTANALQNSSMAGFANTTGKYIDAVSWSGSTSFYEAPYASWYDVERTSPLSLCSWINTSASGSTQVIVSHLFPDSTARGWEWFVGTAGKMSLLMSNNVSGGNYLQADTTNAVNSGAFKRVCSTYSGNSNTSGVHHYINGTSDTVVSSVNSLSATIQDNAHSLDIARWTNNNAGFFNGSQQETWLATAERSADWITADYASQNSPSTYWSVSAASTPAGSSSRRRMSQVY
jgi:hypothetical protein